MSSIINRFFLKSGHLIHSQYSVKVFTKSYFVTIVYLETVEKALISLGSTWEWQADGELYLYVVTIIVISMIIIIIILNIIQPCNIIIIIIIIDILLLNIIPMYLFIGSLKTITAIVPGVRTANQPKGDCI